MLTRGLSQTDFAKRIGRRQSCVNNVLNGRNLPCLEDMDHWAAVLRLTDQARDDFVLMAQLAHCPAQIQSFVREIRRHLAELQDAPTRRIPAGT
jgi:transcriptional regulator with XRE-family HTH domain